MSELTPREQWPEWLQEARTDGALVRVVSGHVQWHGGVWRGGDWRSGIWRDGVWHGGTWLGGVWHGGTWRGGTWYGGDWRGGHSSARSIYVPTWDGSRIHIGCEAKSIPEWDAWFAGDEQFETPRGTEAFQLIHAHYQAIRAWVVAMAEQEARAAPASEGGSVSLYHDLIEAHGEIAQMRQLQEECGELVAAVNHYERGKITRYQLACEMADVHIMLEQARLVVGEKACKEALEHKLDRAKDTLNGRA